MKLIIYSELPVSLHYGNKVDAWWYSRNGFDVEFWDLAPINISDDDLNLYYGGSNELRYIGPSHRTFSSMDDVISSLNECEKGTCFYNISGAISGYTFNGEMCRTLKLAGMILFYGKFYSNLSPVSLIKNIIVYFRYLKRILDGKYITPDVYFGVGRKSRVFINRFYPKVEFIPIPSPLIDWETLPRRISNDYIVFVDETIEYEPDAKLFNRVSCTDLKGYYKRMNSLFTILEETLSLPVVIAASGKYVYPENMYGNREIIYRETFSLIEHAKLLVGHTSAALEHNIKCKKPMLFVDDISFTKYKRKGFASLATLKGNNIYMSDKVNKNDVLNVIERNKCCFDEMVSDYFKEGHESDYKKIIAETFRKYAECVDLSRG